MDLKNKNITMESHYVIDVSSVSTNPVFIFNRPNNTQYS